MVDLRISRVCEGVLIQSPVLLISGDVESEYGKDGYIELFCLSVGLQIAARRGQMFYGRVPTNKRKKS